MATVLVSLIESTGAYKAASRLASATPPTPHSNSFCRECRASRKHSCWKSRVIQISAGFMIFFSMLGKKLSIIISSSLPCIPGLFFIPESPRWLAKMGMTEEFENSLQVLRGYRTDISVEVNEIKTAVASSNRRTTVRFAELKQRRYWLPLMIGIGLLVLQQLSGINGVLFYSSTIFQNAGISSSDAATFGVGAVQLLATTLTLWLADKSGRRLLLIVSSSGMALSLLVVSIAFYLKDYISPDSSLYGILSLLSMGGVVVMVIAFSLGMGAMPWIIMSENTNISFAERLYKKKNKRNTPNKTYRLKPENQEKAAKNAANRAKQTIPHTLGTMTWARFRHRLESDDGREYTRGDMYGPSHKRNNGSFVNAEAQKKS
ncbi:hypothetical protein P8452_65633 [Trifolium repens]|nr:hypothetical protein P8452_65633 [Trifolium repens]